MKERTGRRRTGGKRSPAGWAGIVILILLVCIAGGVLLSGGFPGWLAPAGGNAAGALPSVTPAIGPAPAAPPVETDAVEQYIVLYTNVERATPDLRPLQWDADLAAVARSHSEDMAAHGFFSHVNPKGEDPTDRAVRMKYPVIKSLGGGRIATGIGENIGMMPTGNVADYGYVEEDAKAIAEAMVAMWMASPGHRENILEPGYDRIGVGVAYDGTSYIATQDFW